MIESDSAQVFATVEILKGNTVTLGWYYAGTGAHNTKQEPDVNKEVSAGGRDGVTIMSYYGKAHHHTEKERDVFVRNGPETTKI